METIETQTWIIIAVVVALGLTVIGAWLLPAEGNPISSKNTSGQNTNEP